MRISGFWLIFPFVGAIRLSTVVAFLATLVILIWFRRSPLLAFIAAMGWVSAFEIVYQAVAMFYGQYTPIHLFYLTFQLAGWVVAAYVAGVRPHPLLLVAWGLVFVAWIVFGFQPNGYGQTSPLSVPQELFNMATKEGLAAIYIVGCLAPFGLQSALRSPHPEPNP